MATLDGLTADGLPIGWRPPMRNLRGAGIPASPTGGRLSRNFVPSPDPPEVIWAVGIKPRLARWAGVTTHTSVLDFVPPVLPRADERVWVKCKGMHRRGKLWRTLEAEQRRVRARVAARKAQKEEAATMAAVA